MSGWFYRHQDLRLLKSRDTTMKTVSFRVDNVEGVVLVNNKTVKGGSKELKDGDIIALTTGSSCDVLLNALPCLELEESSGVHMTSHFPPCLHLQTDCCSGNHQYQVLTPVGTVDVDTQVASSPP